MYGSRSIGLRSIDICRIRRINERIANPITTCNFHNGSRNWDSHYRLNMKKINCTWDRTSFIHIRHHAIKSTEKCLSSTLSELKGWRELIGLTPAILRKNIHGEVISSKKWLVELFVTDLIERNILYRNGHTQNQYKTIKAAGWLIRNKN